ncbi:alanine racemase [Tessaracoccus flavus]|uniref:Alanine racemase n=1 Tax=Tessaracoccus flavus TaxID=1610493 RepID=A0A1Q2CBH7_9ACTN|nr:alanine racemase [Tessaracoccus flavus]AQP43458.1 alanine racemase [Tessaracoccus flavus]SDY84152.1 alanine racemase [Tessaracoccus flavus]
MPTPTQLRVDLEAIHANLALARDRANGRSVLAAVKANAYGHGLVPVARSIQERGSADWLGVALTSEAEELRAAGITLPILKFTPTLADDLDDAITAELTLSVGDAGAIRAAQLAAAARGRIVEVHLKIDTGMRRVGAEPGDAALLGAQLADSPNLRVGGIFTHLPVSDVPEGGEFTRAQFRLFDDVVADVERVVGTVPLVHCANSGAVLGHDLGRSTMVRPGIMIYGSYPDPHTPRDHPLSDVARWTSRITFVKRVQAGQTVGYGRTWTAPVDTWVATVAVGYGDGYSRLLSSRGRMLVDGHSYPVIGRVCMDQTMIDLGPDLPTVGVGDEVVLLGTSGKERIGVEEIAELMGTITYEVTCLITDRVPRVY